jgi:hypothetical protein
MIRRITTIAAAAMLLATIALAQTETLPNHIKYKDSSVANGKGHAGGLTLESRTLLGRDGVAHVELTTGSFENGGATGTITKVQLKAGNETDNFNALENDGRVTIQAAGLVRGQGVQIHGNVKSADGTATEVVQVEEIVKLRPDLLVADISAPPQVLPNVSVTIRATIQERNGDVGARANCRLLVDGVESDRAEGIWVDAGGNVQCAFVHTFTAYGNANVQVFVDTTDPADWDDANNSASKTVEVARNVDGWSVHALERRESSESYSHSPLWDIHDVQTSVNQKNDLWAWINHPINLSNVSLSFSASSNGNTLFHYPDAALEPFRQLLGRSEVCAMSVGFPSYRVCFQPEGNSNTPNGFVYVEILHTAADAVYRSWGYNWWVNPNSPTGKAPGVYDRTTIRQDIAAPMGDSVQWDLRLVDGDGTVWHDQPFVNSLLPSSSQMSNPYRCNYAPRYGFQVCSSYNSSTSSREGYATQFQQ